MDKIAEILLNINAVVLRTKPPFRLASGILSPIYTDNRLLMSYPKDRDFIVNSFIKMLKKEKIKFEGFAGTATAGIPWAAWLSQKLKKPMVYVRSEAKENFENANVKLHTLTTFTNLIKTDVKKKYIAKHELDNIMDWKKNPEGW